MADKISLATLALAKAYTDESIEGTGAIKGKNCQIQSITNIEGGHRVTFAWYNESEVLLTDTLDVMNGEQGETGEQGESGVSPSITITEITGGHRVTITDEEHPEGQSFDVMDGEGGSGSGDMKKSVYDNDLAVLNAGGIKSFVAAQIAGKQDTISDLATIRSGASAGASAYQKPVTGIPKTDLASAVQTSLEKADSAVQDVSGKADKTDIAPVENGTTASRAYAVGQQFYLNGSLYKAKAAIAQGATFTIGTNCVSADCITEQIGKSWKYLGKSTGLWSSLPKINVPEGINQYKEFLIVFTTDVSVAAETIQRLVQYMPYDLLFGKFGAALEYAHPTYSVNITIQIANNTNFNCGYTLRDGTMPSDFAISIYGR